MIKSSVEKIAGDIGFDIGHSDDVTQSNLINGFSRALKQMQSDHDLDMQLCYISDKLTKDSVDIIKRLYNFVENK